MSTTRTAPAAGTPVTRAGAAGSPSVVIASHAVRDKMALVGTVSVAMLAMGLLVGALWPSLKDTFADIQDSLPDAFTTVLAGADMSTPSGWANAEMLSMIAPAAIIAVAVISVSKSVAGEEETKTMGVLLGAPFPRSAFLWAKAAATATHVVLASIAVGLGLLLGDLVGDMGLSWAGIAGASLHVAALGLLLGAVALTVSAWSGSSRLTTAVAAGLGGLSFALASFLPLSDSLAEGARTSPWYYYNSSDPLAHGADPLHLAVLLALTALVLLGGQHGFTRRDLRG